MLRHPDRLFEPLPLLEEDDPDPLVSLHRREGYHLKQRKDSLPEHKLYVDDGCDDHPACLTCPFEMCRYDGMVLANGQKIHARTLALAAAVKRLRGEGWTVEAVAKMLDRTKRAIYRLQALP